MHVWSHFPEGETFQKTHQKTVETCFHQLKNIDKYLNRECDGSHGHEPRSGPHADYYHGYTLSMCRAIMKSVEGGRRNGQMTGTRLGRVQMAAAF